MADPGDEFHAHLDRCRRCSERPFDLCPTGSALLKQAATAEDGLDLEALETKRKATR